MKKSITLLPFLLALILLTTTCCSCAPADKSAETNVSSSDSQTDKHYVIGVSQCRSGEIYWDVMKNILVQNAKELGLTLDIQIADDNASKHSESRRDG